MNWQRARTDDKKNERKAAIYQAAYTLFKEKGYDDVSFNGIAAQAGFTKSNMYRYFSSKEDIFLNVFGDLFENWFDDCIAQLREFDIEVDSQHFAESWVNTLLKHSEFLDLTPLMFIALEANSSYEQLIQFKRNSKNLLYQLALEIGRIYPALQGENAFQFLTLSYAASTNYWASSKQNDALTKVYALEEFKDLKPDFERNLTNSIVIIIKGIKADQH